MREVEILKKKQLISFIWAVSIAVKDLIFTAAGLGGVSQNSSYPG